MLSLYPGPNIADAAESSQTFDPNNDNVIGFDPNNAIGIGFDLNPNNVIGFDPNNDPTSVDHPIKPHQP